MRFREGTVVRHCLPDRPDWPILKEEIQLGTKYILVGDSIELKLRNIETGEERYVTCYWTIGNGKQGYMVSGVLEIKEITDGNP